MGYFLFIDESGQDRQASPHEVLAGIAVQDSELWNLVQRTHTLEQDVFGMRISEGKLELKCAGSGTLFNNSITISRREVFGTPDKYVALSVGI
ncbi:MAG: hypothetical protein U9R02_14095 [Thermodesulfobacteriota bacterium]|nr:hypothetical protein [Thermodesulfobacteriota bacterium]